MMTKNDSKINLIYKQLLVVPIFTILILLFSNTTQAQKKGASRELMKEYISKTRDSVIKREDINRLKYIYDLMSDKQKKNVKVITPPKIVNGWTVSAKPRNTSFLESLPKNSDYFIDGEKVTYEKVEALDREKIESVHVKKNQGSNGAVYIILK